MDHGRCPGWPCILGQSSSRSGRTREELLGRLRVLGLRFARSSVGGRALSWVFANMNFLIPAHRLRETDTLVAFHHPRPSYPLHILLVPKRALRSLADLEPSDNDFTTDLFITVQSLVQEFEMETGGYRLIVNGGAYQDVPHLHFHLVAELRGDALSEDAPAGDEHVND